MVIRNDADRVERRLREIAKRAAKEKQQVELITQLRRSVRDLKYQLSRSRTLAADLTKRLKKAEDRLGLYE
jgi:predicted RNase H-like nuclease (RuvC/YqgF family)